MGRITLLDLHTLWNHPSPPCISIFLPTHRKGADTQADPIRLKNLVRAAEERLAALGQRDSEARALLAPILGLVADQGFWKGQAEGLAVFRSPERFLHFTLMRPPVERVVVAGRFHTRPLLPCLAENAPAYVLAVSLNSVRLLRVTAHDADVLPLGDAPASLEAFLRFEEAQQDFQYRQGGQGGAVSGGGPQKDRKDEQRRYLRAIDKALATHLNDSPAPLVFAGVDALFALYREVSGRAQLVAQPLSGNPEHLAPEALRDRALELLRPLREAELEQAAADYRRLAGTGRTAAALAQVLPAAEAGRVERLLLQPDVERWGRFGTENGRVAVHPDALPGDDELLDLAAALTLRGGGAVLPLPAELTAQPELADGVAALLRY